ncbi:DUF6645 domain-containing protein [Escherichia coli]|uniref:DUF6645 domain-containing protein n=1 Tax=Escherichia coli TaxID=562 RepID=UPI000BE5CD98|nr:DUF6645 domain-containing protein [Escherichia coli]ELO7644234.1 sialate O-acetylesterase [Escherichia coli]
MSDSQWKMLSAMPGEFSVKVAGGTVAFIESPFRPSDNKGGITFADCVIRFSTKEPLWVMPVSGNPSAEITSSGVTGIIPITSGVAGTLTPSDWNAPDNAGSSGSVSGGSREPEYYYVVVLAGQSNGIATGEGLPLPDTYDAPDPRIKQLARRSTVTPGGASCAYNDVIPADHCLHDVQDMSGRNHPRADLSKGQYGLVGHGLHIAKKLLPFIPDNAGILLVPCGRGGSAFTDRDVGTFSEASGASEDSARWGVGQPLYQDLISRTKAALAKNPKNVLLAVVWMQGEADLQSANSAQQPALFTAMVKQFRSDLVDYAGQCHGGAADSVPWICGDTTYYWKATYATQYEAVYGAYKNQAAQNIFFVPFMTDENGANTPTNLPAEDPDIAAAGYYGSASRTQANWTTTQRNMHFSSWARRGIISDRLATAILTHAGRTADFISGEEPETTGGPSGGTGSDSGNTGTTTQPDSGTAENTGASLLATGGELSAQGWTFSGGVSSLVDDSTATGGKAFSFSKTTGSTAAWSLTRPYTSGADLLSSGGKVSLKFKLTGSYVNGQLGPAIYLQISPDAIPSGVNFEASGTSGASPFVLAFYVQTATTGDKNKINVYHHCSPANVVRAGFGYFNNEWHTVDFEFAGNNSALVTPVVDGVRGTQFSLAYSPAAASVPAAVANTLVLTDVSTNKGTYAVEVESLNVTVNAAAATA